MDRNQPPLQGINLESLGKVVKVPLKYTHEVLGNLVEEVTKQSKNIFKWFEGLFNNTTDKDGVKESLMGSFIGFLNLTASLGKKEKNDNEEPVETSEEVATVPTQPKPAPSEVARAELKKEVDQAKLKPQPKPFDQNTVRSNGVEKDQNGMTLCSLTAKRNIKMLAPGKTFASIRGKPNTQGDIKKIRERAKKGKYRLEDVIPTGNADDVQQFYLTARHEDCFFGNAQEKIRKLNLSGKTVCDILTQGGTKFDHRAAGFKGNDGKWYVLDPYRMRGSTEPVLYEDYEEKFHVDVLFVVPIDTSGDANPLPTPIVP